MKKFFLFIFLLTFFSGLTFADVYVSGIKISNNSVTSYDDAANDWDGNFSNGPAKIWFIVNQNGVGTLACTLTIKQGMTVIRTIPIPGIVKGVNNVTWNGFDNNNNGVAAGNYTFEISITDPVGHTNFDVLWTAGANPDPDFDGNNTWGYRGIAATTAQTSTAFGNVYIARGTTLTTSINGLYELRADGVFKRKIGTLPVWPASVPIEVATYGSSVYALAGYGFAGSGYVKGYSAESGNLIDSSLFGSINIRDLAIRKVGNDTVFYTGRSGTNSLNAIIKKTGFYGDTTTHINMIPYITGTGYIKAVVFDDDGNAYVAFGELSTSRKKIAKFNSSGTLVYLDSLDGVFGLPTASLFQSLAIYSGSNPNSASDDKLYAVIYGGTTGSPQSGIYSLNMNAAGGTLLTNTGVGSITTSATAIQIYCDAAGNVLLSNGASQERIVAFSPASGPNSFTTQAPVVLNVTNPVPVELTSFSAAVSGNLVQLNWATATETNNQGFEIQRANKVNNLISSFEKIGFVTGNGTTTSPNTYSFVDQPEKGSYVYRLKQIDFNGSFEYSGEVEVDLELPVSFTLEQNFPNPFNPVTTIHFVIDVDAEISLKVFNLLGEEVAALINNEFKSAGRYSVSFNAENLPSGTYVYSLQSGNNVINKKMTLLK